MIILKGFLICLLLLIMSAMSAALVIVNHIVHKDRLRRRLMDESAVDESVDDAIEQFNRKDVFNEHRFN